MNICICDDDCLIHDQIKLYINQFFSVTSEFDFIDLFSAESLFSDSINFNNFDMLFLDIKMSELSGIKAAEIIRKTNTKLIIIFVSAFPNYVFDAFKVEALHYIVKPILKEDFVNIFNRALYKYNVQNSTLNLKWQNERYVLKIDTIKYVEGYKRHITVYTNTGNYEALGKIPEILKILEPHGFIRTHQGFIVNMNYIKRFDSTDIVLFDGTKVLVSVRKRAKALQSFDLFIKNRRW